MLYRRKEIIGYREHPSETMFDHFMTASQQVGVTTYTRSRVRSSSVDRGDQVDLDQEIGVRQARHADERAGRGVPMIFRSFGRGIG
jgi:hypothetical protein